MVSKSYDEEKWELAGTIGVDAGICWVGDPCYILHQEDGPPKAIGKNWLDFCSKLENPYFHKEFPIPELEGQKVKLPISEFDDKGFKQFNYDAGHAGLGVVVHTGYGDGGYPVYIKRGPENRIAEVKVVFISDETDSDESDEDEPDNDYGKYIDSRHGR